MITRNKQRLYSLTSDNKMDIKAAIDKLGNKNSDVQKILLKLYEQNCEASDKITQLTRDNEQQDEQINELVGSNNQLIKEKEVQQGLINRLEKEITHLKDKMVFLEEKQMSNNVIFDNIPEKADKKNEDVEQTVKDFITGNLGLEAADMTFDVCHRFGSQNPRSIVAKFLKRTDKSKVLSKGLKLKNTDYSMNGQVPQELRAAQSVLYERRKEIKKDNPAAKVLVTGKKLIVDNEVIADLNVQRYYESDIDTDTTFLQQVDQMRPKSSGVFEERRSQFIAHYIPIDDPKKIKAALASLHSNEAISRATHNIWAGRFGNIELLDDDREWGAANYILKAMRTEKASGMCVVSRFFGGIHMGKRRFDIMRDMTRNLLSGTAD